MCINKDRGRTYMSEDHGCNSYSLGRIIFGGRFLKELRQLPQPLFPDAIRIRGTLEVSAILDGQDVRCYRLVVQDRHRPVAQPLCPGGVSKILQVGNQKNQNFELFLYFSTKQYVHMYRIPLARFSLFLVRSLLKETNKQTNKIGKCYGGLSLFSPPHAMGLARESQLLRLEFAAELL